MRRLVGLALPRLGQRWQWASCVIFIPGTQHTALVTGFREGELILQPLGHVDGIRPGDCVEALGRGLDIAVGMLWSGALLMPSAIPWTGNLHHC